MKLAMFFISSTKRIFTKLCVVELSSTKIKVRLHGTLIVILLVTAVTYKRRLLLINLIGQYLQN